MNQKLIKMPSIGQLRNAVHDLNHMARYVGTNEEGNVIYDNTRDLPVVCFEGTVKVHGTNASFCMNSENHWFQSKENVLSIEKDNFAFCFFGEQRLQHFKFIANGIAELNNIDLTQNTLTIYGEFAGGNIQKGVAITGLDKMFIIFDVKVTPHDETKNAFWTIHKTFFYDHAFDGEFKKANIYHVVDFPVYKIDIDLNNPADATNTLIELTEMVEKKCPVGEYFGKEGIGEGVVWETFFQGSKLRFKVKGEEHSSSKVKKLASVDVEKVNNVKEFVELSVTENRLNQGIEQVFHGEEATQEMTGTFVNWVKGDVMKEEMDTLVENGLEPKDVAGPISRKAASWFKEFLMRQAGL